MIIGEIKMSLGDILSLVDIVSSAYEYKKNKKRDQISKELQKLFIKNSTPNDYAEAVFYGIFQNIKSRDWNSFRNIYQDFIFNDLIPFMNQNEKLFDNDECNETMILIKNHYQKLEKMNTIMFMDYMKESFYRRYGHRNFF